MKSFYELSRCAITALLSLGKRSWRYEYSCTFLEPRSTIANSTLPRRDLKFAIKKAGSPWLKKLTFLYLLKIWNEIQLPSNLVSVSPWSFMEEVQDLKQTLDVPDSCLQNNREYLDFLLDNYSLLFRNVWHPQWSEGQTNWPKRSTSPLTSRTGLLSYSGMDLHASVLQLASGMFRVSTLGGIQRVRRQGGTWCVLGCSHPETQELIVSKRKANIWRVYIFIQQAQLGKSTGSSTCMSAPWESITS